MTDGLDQALVNAGLALLQADAQLVVYPGGVPDLTPPASPPYVVVYAVVEWPAGAEGDSLDGLSRSPTVRWITHSIGGGVGATPATAEQAARAVGQRVRTALLNKRLVVTGLDLWPIRQEQGAGVPIPDEITGVPVMDLTQTYRASAVS